MNKGKGGKKDKRVRVTKRMYDSALDDNLRLVNAIANANMASRTLFDAWEKAYYEAVHQSNLNWRIAAYSFSGLVILSLSVLAINIIY